MYFSRAWSIFMIIEPEIFCFSIVVTISWLNRNSISRLVRWGIWTFEDVFIWRNYSMRLNRFFLSNLANRCRCFQQCQDIFEWELYLRLWLDLNSLGHHKSLLPWYMTEPLRKFTVQKRTHCWFWVLFSDCVTSRWSSEASFVSIITLVLKEQIELSFNPENFNLHFRRAAELPFKGA